METSLAPQPDVMPKPDLIIVRNGYSFNAEEMQPRLDALAALPDRWGQVHPTIDTTVDDSYLDELVSKITPGSTVVISGGDDTARRTLRRLHAKGFTGEEIDILIAGAGGENVVAQTLHGKDYKDPLAILEGATKRTIFQTEAHMSDEQGRRFRSEEFIFSLGMGATALAMRRFYNDPEWRERQHRRGPVAQWLAKRVCAARAVISAPTIKTSRGRAVDVTISGGQYSGGRALNYDTSLSNPRENVLSVTKRFRGYASVIGRMLPQGRAPGDTWHGPHGTIRIDSQTEAHLDGNNIETIPAGTTIRFQRASRGIAVLALDQAYRS